MHLLNLTVLMLVMFKALHSTRKTRNKSSYCSVLMKKRPSMKARQRLMAQGITGVTYIGLKAQAVQAPPLKVAPGNKYPIIKSTPSLLVELDTALREVTNGVKNVSRLMAQVFNQDNQAALSASLKNIETFSKVLADDAQQIDQSIKSATKLLDNTAKASEKFSSTISSVDQAAQKLANVSEQTSSMIQGASQQALPSLAESLQRLSNLLTNLEGLSGQLQNNPSILVRGRLPAIPGPGE